jgi:hypothetical protein
VIGPAPPDPSRTDDSGLLTAEGRRVDAASWDRTATVPGMEDGELDNVGERTMVTGGMGGFMMDVASEDGVDATVVSAGPPQPEGGEDGPTVRDLSRDDGRDPDDDGPTLQRSAPRISSGKTPPPALAANIHAPAVSELRKPKPSRRTPPGGVPQLNVLQQIVGSQASEPMPVPRASSPTPPSVPTMPILAPPLPAPPPGPTPPSQFPSGTPGAQAQYVHDASGLPMAQSPPAGPPGGPQGGYPQQYPQYPQPQPPQPQPQQPQPPPPQPPQQGAPPPGYPPQPYGPGASPYPVLPGGLYQLSPYGQSQPQPISLTGQLRLSEIDEIPSMYRIRSPRRRWFAYLIAGVIAVSVAAIATFLIIRLTRETAPVAGSVHIESVPPGGEVYFNGTRLTDKTPLTVEGVPIGTRHDIRVELPRHKPHLETIDIPRTGGEVSVTALMKPITGKIVVNSQPGGADILINGQLRGRTPTTLNDIDMASAKKLELRLKGYQPFVTDLEWSSNGQITLDPKLLR